MFIVRAHTPGTGKSYPVDVISAIATGRLCPVITASRSEEEIEKRLGAVVLGGASIVSLDNCTHDLSGDLLCQLRAAAGQASHSEAVRSLGLEVRCGIHTGECERVGDDLAGIAMHIGARVAALAAPGEALVSQTVRDLVAGSDLAFEERGTHVLKGVPDEWRLYRAILN
jgi:class 3 adenylate cyclase